jgi:ABC-2 type transport system permease protein
VSTLRNAWAIFLREMGAYFLSPVAWVVIFLFLLVNGIMFRVFTVYSQGAPRQITIIVESLFNFALFWVLPLSPIITMRLLAEERRSGSFEMLMTAPVTETQAVLGKFLAAQAFYMLLWLSLAPLLVILGVLGQPDWGPIASTYAGFFALGVMTNSLGLLASSVTRNQLVSAIAALSGNLLFFFVHLGQSLFPEDSDLKRLFHYVSFPAHFDAEYFRGILDLRYFVFYLSFAGVFLFLSVRCAEARR